MKPVLILITLLQPYENLTALQGIMAFWDCFHCCYCFLIAVLIIVREASCFPGALKLPSGPDQIYSFITQEHNFRTLNHIRFVFLLICSVGEALKLYLVKLHATRNLKTTAKLHQ